MVAELFIIPESFEQNALFSCEEIEDKVKRLAQDIVLINTYKEYNKLFVNYVSLYPLPFYLNYTVGDLIYNSYEVKKVINRDVVAAMMNIFDKAKDTSLDSTEIIEKILPNHDENKCAGVIAFYKIATIESESQLIYGIDSWYKFRRAFLGMYPKNGKYFIEQCGIYYPNLVFHDRNKVTVECLLENFSNAVIRNLQALNDTFYTYRERDFANESEKYRTFSIECKLDADAASKDKNSAKEHLTFRFLDKKDQWVDVTCYPHLRLCKSDKGGDSRYYYHRIYFHEGLESISDGRILIGHIGEHRS